MGIAPLDKCTVTGAILRADGTPLNNATVVFVVSGREHDGDVVVLPAPVKVAVGLSGNITARLWPNVRGLAGTNYTATVYVTTGAQVTTYATWTLVVPDAPTANLADISDLVPADSVDDATAQVILARAARDEAREARDETQSLRDEVMPLAGPVAVVAGIADDVSAVAGALPAPDSPDLSVEPAKLATRGNVEANFVARTPKRRFGTVALMLADTATTYAVVSEGDSVEAGGRWYDVAASDASDHHVETAAGVRLYILDRLNFRAWGPRGGSHDDGPLLQKALDALEEGEVLDLAWSTLTVSGVAAKCDFTRVIRGKLIAHPDITANAVIKAAPGTQGIEFEQLRIEVDKDNILAEDCAGILFDQCSGGRAIKCTVKGSRNENYSQDAAYGILGTICGYLAEDTEIVNCQSYDAHREGIMGHKCEGWYVRGSRGRNSGYSNIGTAGGSRAHIIGCRSSVSGTTGITMNSEDSIVAHCITDSNATNHGVLIGHLEHTESYAKNCLASGNRVIGSGGRGVSVVYGVNCVISNNVVTDVTNYGIYVIPHPTDPGGCVITGNTVDGCTYGIYAYGSGTGSMLASINTIRNASTCGVLLITNGEVSIIGNTIVDSLAGVNAGGHSAGATLTGDGVTLLKVDGNTMRNIGQNALSCRHLRGLSFRGNSLENINTSNNAFAHIVAVQGTTGGTASRMPTSITINGNDAKGVSTSSRLLNIETNTFGDGVVTIVAANDNVLTDMAPGRIFGGAGAGTTAKMSGGKNQIGTASRYQTITLAAGTTTLTINNSNIAPGINGLPTFLPSNANWPANVRYTLTNGTATLTYSAPVSDATAYMMVA